MTTPTARIDAAAARRAAQAALDARMTAIDAAVDAANRAHQLAEELAEAEAIAAKKYVDAQRAGWSTDELKRIGLNAPTAAPRRRAARRRSSTTEPTPAPGDEQH